MYLAFAVSDSRAYSAHQLELELLNGPLNEVALTLTVQLPWPVLVNGIKSSLISDKSIQVYMKKCVDDAWPGDYGGRSKWDINRFLPWKELPTNGLLSDHIEAQFTCSVLHSSKHCMRSHPLIPLDEVRDIIRAVFYSHYKNNFQLLAVHGPTNPNVPIFFIRIHPPVRFSPHGSPLLLVSVIDYTRLEDLISQGKVDREQFQSVYHRLVTERVSKEVCVIRASSDEEVDLLRYVLRVNSTRMRRSAWQSMNLPRGEDTPWISTFISPIYADWIEKECRRIQDDNIQDGIDTDFLLADFLSSNRSPSNPYHHLHRKSCAFCYVAKVELKSCSRCRFEFYCSTSCQKSHWSVHKLQCSALSSIT